VSKLISELTTLRLGGPAAEYLRAATVEQAIAMLDSLSPSDGAGGPVLVLGGGSNVVVADAGFPGTVLHLTADTVTVDGTTVTADAGAVWDDVVAVTVDAGLGGLECLSGIPGSAGATPVQNVGAYGAEVAATLTEVQLYRRADRSTAWIPAADLDLRYRSSRLKHSDAEVVLRVRFELQRAASAPIRYPELARALGVEVGARTSPARVREAVIGLRRGKGMVLDDADHDTWSVGSFFTNPVVAQAQAEPVLAHIEAVTGQVPPRYPAPGGVKLSAGWLIERAGFSKGFSGGRTGVSLSTKHTLALTNRGTGTTDELLELAREVRDGVRTAFGVTLVPEPVLVGVELG
jgi:UDP-N-acetylmuramate dehydrogenase